MNSNFDDAVALDRVDYSSGGLPELPGEYKRDIGRGYRRFWAKRGIDVGPDVEGEEHFIIGQFVRDTSFGRISPRAFSLL